MNLLSGCFATIFALQGNFKTAFVCIIAGAVFDFCDGLAARALKAYSPMGKELDSLADMVTFGVAPAMIMYRFQAEANFLVYLPLLIAVFSGLRLAKLTPARARISSDWPHHPAPLSADHSYTQVKCTLGCTQSL